SPRAWCRARSEASCCREAPQGPMPPAWVRWCRWRSSALLVHGQVGLLKRGTGGGEGIDLHSGRDERGENARRLLAVRDVDGCGVGEVLVLDALLGERGEQRRVVQGGHAEARACRGHQGVGLVTERAALGHE